MDFIKEFFEKNFNISLENYDFLKKTLKEKNQNSEILSYKVLETKLFKKISVDRKYNFYNEYSLLDSLSKIKNGEKIKIVAAKKQINENYLKYLWNRHKQGYDLRKSRDKIDTLNDFTE